MPKFGSYDEDTTPANDDLVLTKDTSATATKRVTLLNLIKALVSFVSSFTAASTPLSGSELVAISQSGNPRKATVQDIADLAGGGGGTPGGSSTHVQFNDGGALGGDAGLTFNKTTDALTVGGQILAPDGSAAAPSHSFTSQPGMGMSLTTSSILGFYVGGTRVFDVRTGGVYIPTGASLYFGSGGDTAVAYNRQGVLGVTDSSGNGGTLRFLPKTPPQITADQNNYAPSAAPSMLLRLSTDASRTLTGLSLGQADGELRYIINVGAQPLVLAHESASSTAANRFHNTTGADITLTADQQAMCWYDGTAARWRCTKQN